MNKKSVYWKLCIIGAIFLSIFAFTPFVIPKDNYMPMLLGLPRTLWVGILVYMGLIIVTFIGTRVYPGYDKEKEKI